MEIGNVHKRKPNRDPGYAIDVSLDKEDINTLLLGLKSLSASVVRAFDSGVLGIDEKTRQCRLIEQRMAILRQMDEQVAYEI